MHQSYATTKLLVYTYVNTLIYSCAGGRELLSTRLEDIFTAPPPHAAAELPPHIGMEFWKANTSLRNSHKYVSKKYL